VRRSRGLLARSGCTGVWSPTCRTDAKNENNSAVGNCPIFSCIAHQVSDGSLPDASSHLTMSAPAPPARPQMSMILSSQEPDRGRAGECMGHAAGRGRDLPTR